MSFSISQEDIRFIWLFAGPLVGVFAGYFLKSLGDKKTAQYKIASDTLNLFSSAVAATFKKLVLHQQGVLIGGDNLKQSREILSREIKDLARERCLVESLFCDETKLDLEKNYKIWKSEINDLPLITNKIKPISDVDSIRLEDANREFLDYLSKLRLKLAKQDVKLAKC